MPDRYSIMNFRIFLILLVVATAVGVPAYGQSDYIRISGVVQDRRVSDGGSTPTLQHINISHSLYMHTSRKTGPHIEGAIPQRCGTFKEFGRQIVVCIGHVHIVSNAAKNIDASQLRMQTGTK